MNSVEAISNHYDINILFKGKIVDVSTTRVLYLKINEEANNQVPKIEISLYTTNYELFNHFNDANEITFLVSNTNYNKKKEYRCSISNIQVGQASQDGLNLAISGVESSLLKYLTENSIQSYKGYSGKVIKEILGQYGYEVKPDSLTYNGASQVWIKSNMTDCEFVKHLLYNSVQNNSANILGIMGDKVAYLRSIDEIRRSEPVATFVNNGDQRSGKNIPHYIYSNLDTVKSNQSVLLKDGGYSRNINVYDYTSNTYMNSANEENIDFSGNDLESRSVSSTYETVVSSDNVHNEYASSRMKYHSLMNRLSLIEVHVSFKDDIHYINLLDTVFLFNDPKVGSQSLPYVEGKYIVTGIDTIYFNGTIKYIYRLNRDTFNKGNLIY